MPSHPPIKPQLIAGKANKHCPHSKGDPPLSSQIAHAGIDERVTRLTVRPSVEMSVVVFFHAQPFKGGVHAVRFDLWLIFDLLDEVATPSQARTKSCQVTSETLFLLGRQLSATFGYGLDNFANR